ncbi:MAG: hypothetical protein NT154_20535 [Verrucomicrobia bacterium]|nr:hypothetical protein [Verrucomicrobiota bacterium]
MRTTPDPERPGSGAPDRELFYLLKEETRLGFFPIQVGENPYSRERGMCARVVDMREMRSIDGTPSLEQLACSDMGGG